MLKTIIIIFLAIALVGVILCWIFDRIRTAKDLAEIDEIVNHINEDLEEAQKQSYDILKQWSESMDKHEKAYDELDKRYKLLEIELEKKNVEIEKLKIISKEEPTNGDEIVSVQG